MILRHLCFLVLVVTSLTGLVRAQSPDIFRLEYMIMPKNDAEAELSRYKIVANVPLKVRENDNVIIGGEYNFLAYKIGDNPFSTEQC